MSQTTMDSLNAEMLELLEKHLKLANLQVDTALKQEQTRFFALAGGAFWLDGRCGGRGGSHCPGPLAMRLS